MSFRRMLPGIMAMALMAEAMNTMDMSGEKYNPHEPYQPKQLEKMNHEYKCCNPSCEKKRNHNGSYCSPECADIHKQIKKEEFKNKNK